MATFISTFKFTPQGIKGIGDTIKRAEAVKATAKKMGVTVKDFYWTLGDQDGVLITEAPDDESVTALLLNVGALGNVQTKTCRAFSAADMEKILAKTQV
jgi:uncharacterized protein with GYD domain